MEEGESHQHGSSRAHNDATPDRKRQGGTDRASIASSARSSHSRDSLDTTALGESQPLLQQEEQPPAYSPRHANAAPSSVWLRASHAQYSSYGAVLSRPDNQQQQAPATRPVTNESEPSDTDTERQQDHTPDVKETSRRRCWSCSFCRLPRTRAEGVRFVVGFLAMILGGIAGVLFANFVVDQFNSMTETDMLPWPSCSNAKVHRTASFDFDYDKPLDFSLKESINNRVFLPGRLDGKVLIRQGNREQNASIRIGLEMQSSYLTFLEHIKFDKQEASLEIGSTDPAHGGGIFEEDECTAINIIVSIKDGPYVSDFEIAVDHLSLELGRSLRSDFSDLVLHSEAGAIANAQRDVLDLSVSTMTATTAAGDIRGNFPLGDELTLRSEAGSIDAKILTLATNMPEDGLIPAIFAASTDRGNINVRFPEDFAGRDYRVEVKSGSGSIEGTYAHGSRTVLESISGSIKATLMPFGLDTQDSNITTHNVFGPTEIEVQAAQSLPYWKRPSQPMTHTRSRHESVSGSLKLRYPSEWQGSAHGNSLTGGLDAAGHDVKITEHTNHEIRVKKGHGDSRLTFGTVSGNADLLIGG